MTNSNCIWKPIEEFDGRYEVSDKGDVRRKISDDKYSLLKASKQDDGYLRVLLSRPGKSPKLVAVHRLVAIHFVPNPDNKNYVTFRDRNKENVDASNLVWSTYSELQNINEGVVNYGRRNKSRKPRPVTCITTGVCYPTIKAAAVASGTSTSNIVLCISNNRATRSGLMFKYTEDLESEV